MVSADSLHCEHLQIKLVAWPHLANQNLIFDWSNVDFLEQRALFSLGYPFDLTGINVVILVDDVGMSALANFFVLPRALYFELEFKCV